MKWEEIYDRSKVIVRRTIAQLSREEKSEAPEEEKVEEIIQHLQDSDYLWKKLNERRRYNYQQAYRQLKNKEAKRKRLRLTISFSAAACLMLAFGLALFLDNRQQEVALPLAEHKVVQPGGIKAILERASGEKLVLSRESHQLSEEKGAVLMVDSVGIQYDALEESTEDSLVYNTLIVPRGGVYQLTLADGTKVWLNSDSRLTYPVVFSGDKREVQLCGEAYFNVKKDERKAFIVTTGLGEVKVLGTQFNVKCYPEEASMATTLVSGSVSFSNEMVRATRLSPGYQLVFTEGSTEVVMKQVNVQHYVSWKDNQIVFQSESLENIMRLLSRWYNIDVAFANEELKQLVFSGNLDKYDRIESFFTLFEAGSDVRFELNGNKVLVKSK